MQSVARVAFVEPVGLRAGETVLITGASGGVGSAAVQLAKRGGAVVIAVVSASKADEITSLGASKVVARQTELRAAVGSEAVDVAVDVAGGRGFQNCWRRFGAAGGAPSPDRMWSLIFGPSISKTFAYSGARSSNPVCSATLFATSNGAR
jgi:NADPH:quinone reductase-like Zn-dependent oxidoreductase